MSNDLGKDFRAFQQKVAQSLRKFPVLAAAEAQNFFLDSFKRQAWIGDTTEIWAKRKPNAKRNNGRALLVDTGRLKRSIRIKRADWNNVIIASDVPYAGVHNDGFRGTYERTATRKVKVRGSYGKLGDEKRKSKRIALRGATHKVHQNIPRRRFMGNSPFLNKRIDRVFIRELMKIQ